MRLVWLVLNDGRSVVAGCGSATRDSLAAAIASPGTTITVSSVNGEEYIPGSAVRDFVLFDSRSSVPPTTAISRLIHL